MLTYRTDRFSYVKEVVYDGPRSGKPAVFLTLWNQQLSKSIIAALPGRKMTDLLGTNGGIFFAAKSVRIQNAAVMNYPGQRALRLFLGILW